MPEQASLLSRLSLGQRWSIGLGVVVIILGVAGLGWWAWRPTMAVLFSDLGDADAGVVVAELDRLKLPHALGDDGRSILVPTDSVHKTRMMLMSRPLPLHGAVGFELFNTSEFGVSDFVQKVNYQRALQGELTRTILAIEEVQSARVHLALPDQALFRRDSLKAKASVAVTMRPGRSLRSFQVVGIQRLVAASVPDVKADDVTVVDQHGGVLSRASDVDGASGMARLETRQALEQHLERKAMAVLNRMFRPGEALVTVDVVLNHQQMNVVTEQVLPGVPPQKDQLPTGVVVRERTTSRDNGGDISRGSTASAALISQEVDYLSGKRIEQLTSTGGDVERLNVAVVLRSALAETDRARVKRVVGASVGLNTHRGDLIEVEVSSTETPDDAHEPATNAEVATSPVGPGIEEATSLPSPQWRKPAYLVGFSIVLLTLLAYVVRRRFRLSTAPVVREPLSNEQRETLLRNLQHWLSAQDGRA